MTTNQHPCTLPTSTGNQILDLPVTNHHESSGGDLIAPAHGHRVGQVPVSLVSTHDSALPSQIPWLEEIRQDQQLRSRFSAVA